MSLSQFPNNKWIALLAWVPLFVFLSIGLARSIDFKFHDFQTLGRKVATLTSTDRLTPHSLQLSNLPMHPLWATVSDDDGAHHPWLSQSRA